jgi:hypothetical protein
MADAPQTEASVVDAKVDPALAVETPAVETKTEPAVETKAEEPKVEAKTEEKSEPHPLEVPSLLEEVGKEKAPGAEAAATAEPSSQPQAIEWEFKLPDALQADEPTLGRFRENLSALLSPKEGETPSHAAQRLIDMHGEAMAAYDKQLRDNQVKVWNDTRANWRTQAKADPVIGGAGYETAMGAIARTRDIGISSFKPGTKQYDADAKEFNDFLRITGAGDHPAFLKFVHRLAQFVDEPSAPTQKGSPPPDAGKRPGRSLYAEPSAR